MAKRKISKKVEQAAEKYLASLGSSRDHLTETQWEIVARHVKTRKAQKIGIPLFILFGVLSIFTSLYWLKLGQKATTLIIPNEVNRESIANKEIQETKYNLTADLVRIYTKSMAFSYWMSGTKFMLMLFCFWAAFVEMPLRMRTNRKFFEAFIPHVQEPKQLR